MNATPTGDETTAQRLRIPIILSVTAAIYTFLCLGLYEATMYEPDEEGSGRFFPFGSVDWIAFVSMEGVGALTLATVARTWIHHRAVGAYDLLSHPPTLEDGRARGDRMQIVYALLIGTLTLGVIAFSFVAGYLIQSTLQLHFEAELDRPFRPPATILLVLFLWWFGVPGLLLPILRLLEVFRFPWEAPYDQDTDDDDLSEEEGSDAEDPGFPSRTMLDTK